MPNTIINAKRVLRLVPGILLAVGLWVFWTERNQGRISPRTVEFFQVGWFVMLAALFPLVNFYRERRYFGRVTWKKFQLQPVERLVFKGSISGPIFYPNASDFRPDWRIRDWSREKPPGCAALRVRAFLTDRRVVFRSIFGYNWRDIPLSAIGRVIEGELKTLFGRSYPISLIEYEYNGHRECIAVPTGSPHSRKFTDEVRHLTSN